MELRLGWRIGDRKWNIYKTPEDRERQKIKCAAELDSYSQKIFGKSVPNDQLFQTYLNHYKNLLYNKKSLLDPIMNKAF